MLKQGLYIFDQYKKINSRISTDYLSVLNKRLLGENEQLKKIKQQSAEIIKTLNESLEKRDEKISELQGDLEIIKRGVPRGEVEKRI